MGESSIKGGMAALITVLMLSGCASMPITTPTGDSAPAVYGVPVTERTLAQRLLDQSIEHTAKVNIYAYDANLQSNSRIGIDSFNSDVLLTGEVPSAAIKTQIGKIVSSMPDSKRVYNQLSVGPHRSYSYTVLDGYITTKLKAKIAASQFIKSSQVKIVSNDGTVYVMGRLTPTQQSHLIDLANATSGIIELVLLTDQVNTQGQLLSPDDIMSEADDQPDSTSTSTNEPQSTQTINDNNAATVKRPPVDTSTAQPNDNGYVQRYQDNTAP